MPIVIAVSTPTNAEKRGHRIRFLATHTLFSPSSPQVSPASSAVISNNDLLAAAPNGDLQALISARDNGLPPLPPGVLTQAQADALLNSHDPTPATPVVLTNRKVLRATVDVIHRGGPNGKPGRSIFYARPGVDASGRLVLNVFATRPRIAVATATEIASPFNSPTSAYIELRAAHSEEDR